MQNQITIVGKLKKFLLNFWPLILILVVAGFMMFFRLGRDSFWDWDECIYSQYGKTMKLTGNFLTNQWLGQARLEKPPLYSWLLQVPYLFGINEFNARVLSVIATFVLLIFVYFFAKKFFSERVAVLSTLLMLTAETLVVYSIRVNTDTFFTLFIFLGFFFWILSDKKSKFSYLSGLFFASSVMVKGLGITAYLTAIFLSILINFKREKFMNFIKMLSSFLVLIVPWHIYEYFTYGNQFIHVYIVENLIQRAKNPIEFHFGGRLFYIKLAYEELQPWILAIIILPLFYLLKLKKYLSLKAAGKELRSKEILFTLLLLIIIPFISISSIQTKIAWYLMPIYPFLAIFLAYSLDLLLKNIRHHFLSTGLMWLFILLIATDAFWLLYRETKFYQSYPDISPRNKVAIISRNYPQKSLDYLVQFSERRGRETLAPNLTTSTTFVYGGNACAVYYSDKKVNYYYSTTDFVQRVKRGGGLYLIENGDLHFINQLPVKTLYKNSDFKLFEN